MHLTTSVARARTTRRPRPRSTSTTAATRLAAALVALVTTLLVAAGGAPSASAAPVLDGDVDRLLQPRDGLLFGMSVAPRDHPNAQARLDEVEATLGRRLDAHRWYARWDDPWPAPEVVDTVADGRVPVLSVESRRHDGSRISWASIARGDHDARIVAQARAVRSLGVPVALSFQHEPEFADEYGSPADYRAAWRHYVDVFRAQGARDVLWTWIVTPTVFLDNPPTADDDVLYPGDDVVDWIGLDAYNWNGCMANGQNTWRPMARIAERFRAFGAAHGKPLMLAEWGSVEDPADPGRKAAWIRESMSTVMAWPEMKAILYFDHHGNCPWWVDSSPQSLKAFTEIAGWRSAHGRTQAWLRASHEVGPAPLTVTFDGSASTAVGRATGWGITSWRLELGDGTVRSGSGQPPAGLTHTYPAGSYAARLTVTDKHGTSATDEVRVAVAGPPELSAGGRELTARSGVLTAWVDGHGLAGDVHVEWGTTTAYGRSAVVPLPAVPYVKTVKAPMDGLEPGTRYHFRVTATTAAGSGTYTGTFTTPAR